MTLLPEQITKAAELVRAGASEAAVAQSLGMTEEDFQGALDKGELGEEEFRPLWAAIYGARNDARLAAEIELRQKQPATWLRLQAAGRGGKLQRLLGKGRFEEVHQRLTDGQSPDYVAKVIQEEMGHCRDVARESLARTLRLYRSEKIGVVPIRDLNEAEEEARQKLEAKLGEMVDVAERFRFLINVQSERVLMATQRERSSKVYNTALFRDIDVLRATVEGYAKFQLETGLIRRRPVEIDMDVRSFDVSLGIETDARTLNQVRQATVALLEAMKRDGQGPEGQQG